MLMAISFAGSSKAFLVLGQTIAVVTRNLKEFAAKGKKRE
jgi:hypothetical protein